jgi:hypothetical protein
LKYKALCKVFIAAIFTRELEEFFALDCSKVVGLPQIIPQSTIDKESFFIDTLEEDEEGKDKMTRDALASSTTTSKISNLLIDLVLLGETSRNFLKVFDDSDPNLQIGCGDSQDYSPEILSRID